MKPVLHRIFNLVVILTLAFSVVGVTPAYAAGIIVNTNADTFDIGNGKNCSTVVIGDLPGGGDGLISLREAICAANNTTGADEITFAGNYTITLNGSQLPLIVSEIIITGNGATKTIIDANATLLKQYRAFSVDYSGALTLDGVTVKRGMLFSNGILDSTNTGGGIFNAGSLTIKNSVFSNNGATYGGAIASIVNSLTVQNSTFSNNSSAQGGSIFVYGSIVNITDSVFSNNLASGGGIYNVLGIVTITNSTFSGNYAPTHAGTSTLGLGGGIYNYFISTITVRNSTFSGNGAEVAGGSIYNDKKGTLNLTNTILANSTGSADCYSNGALATDTNNLIESNAAAPNNCGAPVSTADPSLGPLANNGGPTQTFALLSGSPAIDSGDNAACPATDQRGVIRPQNGVCDIGAYEVDTVAPTLTVNQAASQFDPTNASPIHFTAVFSEAIDAATFTSSDMTLGGTAPGALAASVTEIAPNNGTTFDIAVNGMTGDGVVTASILAGKMQDIAGNDNAASVSSDNSVAYDGTSPTTSVSSAANNPTNASPIPIDITFSENVTGFTLSDIVVGNGAAGNFSGAGTTYSVDITPAFNGIVTVDVTAGVAQDTVGNNNLAATRFSITYDNASPTTSISSAANNPTNASPIPVDITFSENVTGFTLSDIVVGNGAAGNFSGAGTTYSVDITPASNGIVTVDVAAGVAQDTAGNTNLDAAQFSAAYDTLGPAVANTSLAASYATGPATLDVIFNENVYDPTGNANSDDVTNPANYLLVKDGLNGAFDSLSCAGGPTADDIQITIDTVLYDNATFTATLNFNGGIPLSAGSYRLFVCGTTSIADPAGNTLNSGINDSTYNFIVFPAPLPATGFPIGRVTKLTAQPVDKTYATTGLTLEITALDLNMPIVGVPLSDDGWDVSWLGQSAGWLTGSAYPTWEGNTVLTAHVWDAYNNPGPFAALKTLRYGDRIRILAYGQTYTYAVRESKLFWANTASSRVFQHEERDWITLLTCETYNPFTGDYFFRRAVRAVLVDVR